MKSSTTKTLFSSVVLAGALFSIPVAVFAENATTATPQVRINGDGIVTVKNTEVTSISGNIINAVSRFKNTLLSWTFTTNASTTMAGNTLPADIQVGDKLSISGALSSFGSTIAVTVNKIMDINSMTSRRTKSGTVQSITMSNTTFVAKMGDKLITVQTNASTTFVFDGKATSTAAFTSLVVGGKVSVTGTLSTDGTTIIATKVSLKIEKESERVKKEKKLNEGSNHGLKNGWKDKEDRTNSGEHKGFLKNED